MTPSQHILIHLDNFISFSSIAAASLSTFKSFGAGYLTIERAPPIALLLTWSYHMLD